MDQRIFVNKDKLAAVLAGDAKALRSPVGYAYENDKPRALFVGTQRDDKTKLFLTDGGDLQFNLKPARTKEEEDQGEGDTQEDLQLNAAQDIDVDANVAGIQEEGDQVGDDNIPF